MRSREKIQDIFETGELTKLVGVKPIYLNKFIERGVYGIKPSIRPGKKRERRRLFSRHDVFGVALVWWLFESGLRSGAIRFVLNQICKVRNAPANQAARKLLDRKAELLAIKREPRSVEEQEAEYPEQRVEVVDHSRVPALLSARPTGSILLIPVGNLFATLMEKIESM